MSLSQEAVQSMLDAMKIITSSQINNISYDKTIVCTIADNSHAAKESYYTVSDGSVKFKAYVVSAEDTTKYKVNDQVYVKIPGGDYARQKIIEGYYVAETAEVPATYISPLTNFLDIKTLTDDSLTDVGKELIANETVKIPIWNWAIDRDANSEDDLQASGIYNTLALQGEFQCLLDRYKMKSGSYGLELELRVRLHPTSELYTTKVLRLDSSEMFGNPYAFSLYSAQAKSFDISELGIIDGMVLYFYQDNNFYYYDEKGEAKYLDYPVKPALPNIKLRNVYVGMGSDLSRVADNSVKIYNLEDKVFKHSEPNDTTNKKNIGFMWYNKSETDEYIGFSDGVVYLQKDANGNETIQLYDELEYIAKSEANNRLLAQKGKDVPNDKNGLEVSANVNEAEKIIISINNLLQVNLVNTLQELYQRTSQLTANLDGQQFSSNDYFNNKDTGLIPIAQAQSDIIKTDFSELMKWYKEAMSAGATLQKHQSEGTIPEKVIDQVATEDTYEKIYQLYITLVNNYRNSGIILNKLKTVIEKKYSGFQSVYDTYSIKLSKIFENLDKNFALLGTTAGEGLLFGLESRMTSSSENKEGYQYIYDNEITPFESQDFSIDDNRYCVYWYRYDENYSGDEILEPGWRRFLPGEAYQSTSVDLNSTVPINLGLPGECSLNGSNYYLNASPKPEESYLTIYLNPNKKEEKFKVVVFYNHQKYVSDELVFTNADEVPDTTTLDVNASITISHGNQSNSNYQTFYSSTNSLINSADSSINRTIVASYDGAFGDNNSLIDAQIFWYVPKNSTMLAVNNNRLENTLNFTSNHYRVGKVLQPIQVVKSPFAMTGGSLIPVEGMSYNVGDTIEKIYEEQGGFYSLTPEAKKDESGRWIPKEQMDGNGEMKPTIEMIDNLDTYLNGYTCYYKTIKGVESEDSDEKVVDSKDLEFEYKIKEHYVPTALNNTIFCIVKKADYKFESSISMSFGTQGTCGTDYTLLVQPVGTDRSVTADPLSLSVQLFNYNNEEVPIYDSKLISGEGASNLNITWCGPSVYTASAGFKTEEAEGKEESSGSGSAIDSIDVALTSEDFLSNNIRCGIMKVSLALNDPKYGGVKDLSVKYPVAYSANGGYIEGPTTIIYDSNGSNPTYYKEKYRLFDDNNIEVPGLTWKIHYYMQEKVDNDGGSHTPLFKFDGTEIEAYDSTNHPITDDIKKAVEFYRAYMPKLNTTNILVPSNMYIDEVYMDGETQAKGSINAYPVVCAYNEENVLVWAQPIVIDQNRYPNAMVNAWDGEFKIDEQNGTIMSSMVGAGYKNADNTYSGVLMGNISGSDTSVGNKVDVGLYGFHHGAQSFGLNIDGTAFFGKAGRGRILIDGNNGTIESASYAQKLDGGMRIDLDDGIIDMKGVATQGSINESYLSSGILDFAELGALTLGLVPKDSLMTKEEYESLPNDDYFRVEYPTYSAYEKQFKLLSKSEWEALSLDDERRTAYSDYKAYFEAIGKMVKSYKQSHIRIDVSNPYFTIHSANQVSKNKYLMYVGDDEYYLQSDNYISTTVLPDNIKRDDSGYLYREEYFFGWGNYLIDNDTGKKAIQRVYVDGTFQPLKDDNDKEIVSYNFNWLADSSVIPYAPDGEIMNLHQEISEEDRHRLVSNITGSGTRFNLQTGHIDAYNFLLTSKNVLIDSRAEADPFFVIKDNDGCILFHTGQEKGYYLQSHGYSTETQQGMKIDLFNGLIDGYNFHLKANATNDEFLGSYISIDSGVEEGSSPSIDVYYQRNEVENGTLVLDDNGNVVPIQRVKMMEVSGENFILRSKDWVDEDNIEDITYTVKIKYHIGRVIANYLTIRDTPKTSAKSYGRVETNDRIKVYNYGTQQYTNNFFSIEPPIIENGEIKTIEKDGQKIPVFTEGKNSTGRWLLEQQTLSDGDHYYWDFSDSEELEEEITITILRPKIGQKINIGEGQILLRKNDALALDIKSSADNYPIQLGTVQQDGTRNFKIGWDGSLAGGSEKEWTISANGSAEFEWIQCTGGEFSKIDIIDATIEQVTIKKATITGDQNSSDKFSTTIDTVLISNCTIGDSLSVPSWSGINFSNSAVLKGMSIEVEGGTDEDTGLKLPGHNLAGLKVEGVFGATGLINADNGIYVPSKADSNSFNNSSYFFGPAYFVQPYYGTTRIYEFMSSTTSGNKGCCYLWSADRITEYLNSALVFHNISKKKTGYVEINNNLFLIFETGVLVGVSTTKPNGIQLS